jgi:hypothetical protein
VTDIPSKYQNVVQDNRQIGLWSVFSSRNNLNGIQYQFGERREKAFLLLFLLSTFQGIIIPNDLNQDFGAVVFLLVDFRAIEAESFWANVFSSRRARFLKGFRPFDLKMLLVIIDQKSELSS